MPDYTKNTRATKPDTGSLTGTWGSVANEAIFDLLDEALGFVTHANADGDETLTISDGVDADGRAMCLVITGALTAGRTITLAPNTTKKVWIIRNATTGGFDLTIQQGSGATVAIPMGYAMMIYADGAGAGGGVYNALDGLVVTNLQGTIQTAAQAVIDHDQLAGFVANEHLNHASIAISAGEGLSGGGSIAANRSLALNIDGLTAEATPDGAADYVAIWDPVAAAHRKVLLNDLPGGGGGGGTVTSVGVGDGLDVADPSTTPVISLDLSELAEKTGDLVGSDRMVVVSAAAQYAETISAIPLSIFSNDSGWTSNAGTVTSVGLSLGNGLDGSVADPGTTPVITLSLDLNELDTSVADGDGDFFVVVDALGVARKLTKGNIELAGFNGPLASAQADGDYNLITSIAFGKISGNSLGFVDIGGAIEVSDVGDIGFFATTPVGQRASPLTLSLTGNYATDHGNIETWANAIQLGLEQLGLFA